MFEKLQIAYQAYNFLTSPEVAPVIAGVAAGLFAVSEALSVIPQVKANGVFQAVYNVLKKLAKK